MALAEVCKVLGTAASIQVFPQALSDELIASWFCFDVGSFWCYFFYYGGISNGTSLLPYNSFIFFAFTHMDIDIRTNVAEALTLDNAFRPSLRMIVQANITIIRKNFVVTICAIASLFHDRIDATGCMTLSVGRAWISYTDLPDRYSLAELTLCKQSIESTTQVCDLMIHTRLLTTS